MKFIILVFVSFLLNASSFAAEGTPRLLDLPQHVLDDSKNFIKTSFRKESLPAIGVIAASTLVLLHYDEDLRKGAMKLGENVGISSKDRTKVYLRIGHLDILNGPNDTGSALYFLGDGWLHGAICASFYAYGALNSNDRALRTGYALGEGIITTALITQVIKHSTGRESPSTTAIDGGVWRFFPNQLLYAKHTHKYDAFPSGHVTTAMMTTTVLSNSYPDNPYIVPVGYTLISLLAFQMVNNGAHWASDYPLALGIGYTVGKIAVNNVNGTKPGKSSAEAPSLRVFPYFTESTTGVMAFYRM